MSTIGVHNIQIQCTCVYNNYNYNVNWQFHVKKCEGIIKNIITQMFWLSFLSCHKRFCFHEGFDHISMTSQRFCFDHKKPVVLKHKGLNLRCMIRVRVHVRSSDGVTLGKIFRLFYFVFFYFPFIFRECFLETFPHWWIIPLLMNLFLRIILVDHSLFTHIYLTK